MSNSKLIRVVTCNLPIKHYVTFKNISHLYHMTKQWKEEVPF